MLNCDKVLKESMPLSCLNAMNANLTMNANLGAVHMSRASPANPADLSHENQPG